MDRISVLGLEVQGEVGVYDHERGVRRPLVVDVEVAVPPAEDDALSRTLDYDQLAAIARDVIQSRHHDLIETIAQTIAAQILALGVLRVRVGVEKPGAVPDARTVRVDVERSADRTM